MATDTNTANFETFIQSIETRNKVILVKLLSKLADKAASILDPVKQEWLDANPVYDVMKPTVRITSVEDARSMPDDSFAQYMSHWENNFWSHPSCLLDMLIYRGYKRGDGYCPILIARHLANQINSELRESASQALDIDPPSRLEDIHKMDSRIVEGVELTHTLPMDQARNVFIDQSLATFSINGMVYMLNRELNG